MPVSVSIPVLIHVPKNAGTYVQSVIEQHALRVHDKVDDKVYKYYRKISITTPTSSLTVQCLFLSDYWVSDKNMKRHPVSVKRNVDNPRAGTCSWDTFVTYIQNSQLRIISISVEPVHTDNNPFIDLRCGLFQAHELINISKNKPDNYIILRDPYDRHQSLYQYINSDDSIHEPTHKSLPSNTFEQYILSDRLEDSWLIRCMMSPPQNCPLNMNWVRAMCSFFESYNFNVYDVINVNNMIDNMQIWDGDVPTNDDRDRAHANKTQYKQKIPFESLSDNAREKFLSTTMYDRKLWELYK